MIRQISRKLGRSVVFFNKKENSVSSASKEDLEEDAERERKIREIFITITLKLVRTSTSLLITIFSFDK